ncbi:ankyrin repeat domain-containing protein [Candidatus Palauibacter sp.]|uniref:ankyrin repeat domain-containing protein n=1 Tax=Candidatus Palauibacter sp. TaxID=3101350 RepID=UPI003B01A9EC
MILPVLPLLTALSVAPAQTPCDGWTTREFWRTADTATVGACLARGHGVGDRSSFNDGTPLHLAAGFSDDPDVIGLLVDAGASLEDAPPPALRTPLHWAARYNENVEVLRALLEYDPNIYAVNDRGRTPLHLAALYNDNPAIVEELARITYVNVTMRDGRTPLHDAARRLRNDARTGPPNPGVAEVLLRKGADLSAEARGSTPEGWAEDRRVVDAIREEESRRAAIRERFLRDIATRVAVGSLVLGVLGYFFARRRQTRSRLSS